MAALRSVSDARQQLLSTFRPGPAVSIAIDTALGRILAEDIQSDTDWPPFASSSMDGFAVRMDDVREASQAEPVELPVVFDIPAGSHLSQDLQPGEAARIMTGAPIPPGADLVVPIEDTNHHRPEPGSQLPASVKISDAGEPGAYIRPVGQDLHKGQSLLQRGHRLRPQDIGMLATLGIPRVSVYACPRIAILSTGDELVPPEQPLLPGQIHDSNSHTLAALVQHAGGNPIVLGTSPDRAEAIRQKLDQAVEQKVELILTSAGVSVGTYDYVRQVIESEGRIDFWRVDMRPGKPVAFGQYKDVLVIGLPGNPASAFVGFEVFVRPAIYRMSGYSEFGRTRVKVNLAHPIESDGRESYLRAIISYEDEKPIARLTGHQGSGNLFSLVQANALLIIPSGVKSLPAGSEVDAWLLEV